MKTQTVFVVSICALLFVSAFECKKPKDAKERNFKEEGKPQKEVDGKQHKENGQKAEKAKPEKASKAGKQDKPQEIKVREVIIEAPEVIGDPKDDSQGHAHSSESMVDTINHHQQKPVIKPKSLKMLNAYEQCKLECKKQRDNVHAQDYVEQLRAELAAAEAALAEETAAIAASSTEATVHHDNFS